MNKKIIKALASITCGLGIITSIPFASSSCGCSKTTIKALPDEVYKYDETDHTILTGFKDDFLNNPDSEIYKDNFKDCNAIFIPSGVKQISTNAFFSNIDNDTTIPSYINFLNMTESYELSIIGANAFKKSSSLKSIKFNENLTVIGNSAFSNSTSFSSISFPENLQEIGLTAFQNCESLKKINFTKCTKLISIGMNCFYSCVFLSSINLVNCEQLQTIGSSAFKNCLSVNSLTLFSNQNQYNIGNSAFQGCLSLNNITWKITDSLANIIVNTYAFDGISSNSSKIKCIGNKYNSLQLLEWLQGKDGTSVKGNFPTEGWTPID